MRKGVIRLRCDTCKHPEADKGRACDGRRAYRCKGCGQVWTSGLQGRRQSFNTQRLGFQFADTGSLRGVD